MSVKRFRRSRQSCFQRVKNTPLSKFLHLEISFLSDFKQISFWKSLKSFSWQKCFLSVCKIFLMTRFFWHEIESRNFSRSFIRNLLIFFWKFFSPGSSKSLSRCREELFEDKNSWKIYCFILTFRIGQNVSGI